MREPDFVLWVERGDGDACVWEGHGDVVDHAAVLRGEFGDAFDLDPAACHRGIVPDGGGGLWP